MDVIRPPDDPGVCRTRRLHAWRHALAAIALAFLIALGIPHEALADTSSAESDVVTEQQDTKSTGSTSAVAPTGSSATAAAPRTTTKDEGVTDSAATTKGQSKGSAATETTTPPAQGGGTTASEPSQPTAQPQEPVRSEGTPSAADEQEGQAQSPAVDEPADAPQPEATETQGTSQDATAAQGAGATSASEPAATSPTATTQPTTTDATTDGQDFDTNLEGTAATTGSATIVTGDKGLQITSDGATDAFWISNSEYGDVTYSADVEFVDPQGAATLVFHSNGDLSNHYAYFEPLCLCRQHQWRVRRVPALQVRGSGRPREVHDRAPCLPTTAII